MPGPRFCRLAPLLPAYAGAVAARQAQHAHEQDTAERSPIVPVPDAPQPAQRTLPAAEQPVRPIEIQMGDHVDLFSFGASGG